jgi:hypothetical protein
MYCVKRGHWQRPQCHPSHRSMICYLSHTCWALISLCYFVDIVLRCPSGLDHNLPDESHISLKVLLDDNRAKIIGPLIKGSESSWKSVDNLQLWVYSLIFILLVEKTIHIQRPTGVLSFKITPRRLENHEFTPLGSAEFFCDNLVAMSLAQISGTKYYHLNLHCKADYWSRKYHLEVVQPLVTACNGPTFELCFSCVVIPSDEPPTVVVSNEGQIHQGLIIPS